MSRLLPLALLLLLSSALLGSSCDAPRAVDMEELRRDVAPPFRYELYCDSAGKLVGDNSAVLLVYRSEHLERVYSDAQAGHPRAQALFAQLEQTLHGSGGLLAERATGLVCHSAPACTVQWQFLDELMPSRGPGGLRLRQVLADSFSRQARLQGVRNAVIAAAVSVLLATTVVKGAAVGAAETEAATGAAGVSSTEAGVLARQALLEQRFGRPAAAVEEVAALEARLAQALEAAPRHPARLDTLARLRPSVERPPTLHRRLCGPAHRGPGIAASRREAFSPCLQQQATRVLEQPEAGSTQAAPNGRWRGTYQVRGNGRDTEVGSPTLWTQGCRLPGPPRL